MLKNIIYEDDSILVVNKPSGIATQTARLGQQDMVSELKNYLARKPENRGKGEPYLGVVHRLDQPVAGLIVFAKTKDAAANLSRQIVSNQVEKIYYAVVFGKPKNTKGRLEDYLFKDTKTNQSLVVKADFPGAKKAILEYSCVKTLFALETDGEVTLIRIKLLTGRHHQIRAQMSKAGMPLLGDGKYGSEASRDFDRQAGLKNVALCAYKLTFLHPLTGKLVTYEKQPEGDIFLPFFTGIV